jgi:hypothetical protein
VISWVHFHIFPSAKQGMSLYLLMITHAILGVYFLRKKFEFFLASQRLQSFSRGTDWEEDQDPSYGKWGGVYQQIRS